MRCVLLPCSWGARRLKAIFVQVLTRVLELGLRGTADVASIIISELAAGIVLLELGTYNLDSVAAEAVGLHIYRGPCPGFSYRVYAFNLVLSMYTTSDTSHTITQS